MSTPERETHFLGFAKLLWTEIHQNNSVETLLQMDVDELDKRIEGIIARRAYDLARHCLNETIAIGSTAENFMYAIPDLTAWPEEQKGS